MDASNPIVSGDRRELSEIIRMGQVRMRQNLSYLRQLGESAKRYPLPMNLPLLGDAEVRDRVVSLSNSVKTIELSSEPLRLDKSHFAFREKLPICGWLSRGGVPYHPPSIANSKGFVVANRVFGGAAYKPQGANLIAQVLGDDFPDRPTTVYTYGTPQGFLTRLNMQMSRKCVPINRYGMSKGVVRSPKSLMKVLDTLFPTVQSEGFPSLEDPLEDNLYSIKITGNSSAGPPYWRHKVDAIGDVLEVVSRIMYMINEDRMSELYSKEPELFLCEVKNKLDRYKWDDLDVKTRPYTTVPAHFSLLFSVLSQRFGSKLQTFVEDKKSVNAYGFSAANGGMKAMVNWMESTKEGEFKFVVYGDDTRITFRKGGVLYMVNPDFKQMDGSVDACTIELTIKWIMAHLFKEDGLDQGHKAWDAVAKMWFHMATQPWFVVHGTEVWHKNQKDGLMTGVVGTTLFDTVKAALSWEHFKTVVQTKGFDFLFDGSAVADLMLKECGLVVKEGTWNPVVVRPWSDLQPNELYCEQKFLGVQILKMQLEYEGKYSSVAVPTIPEDEMVEMLLVQKDDPLKNKKNRGKVTVNERLLFDRMRGYMITWGFTNPRIMQVIHHVVNNLSPEAILMDTVVKNGEKPESILLAGGKNPFEFPNSDGFPTQQFCLMLYSKLFSEEDRKPFFIPLFEGLHDALNLYREDLVLARRVFAKSNPEQNVKDLVLEKVQPDEIPVLVQPAVIGTAKVPDFHKTVPNLRSEISQLDDVLFKYFPNLPMSLSRFVHEKGGTCHVGDVVQRFGISTVCLVKVLAKTDLFATGFKTGDILSVNPILTPLPTCQDEIHEKRVAEARVISQNQSMQQKAMEQAKIDEEQAQYPKDILITPFAPVKYDAVFVANAKGVSVPSFNDAPLTAFVNAFNRGGYSLSFTSVVDSKEKMPVKVMMFASPNGRLAAPSFASWVAETRSLKASTGKELIARALMDQIDFLLSEEGKPPIFRDYLASIKTYFRQPPARQPFDETNWAAEVANEKNEYASIKIEAEEGKKEDPVLSREMLLAISKDVFDIERMVVLVQKRSPLIEFLVRCAENILAFLDGILETPDSLRSKRRFVYKSLFKLLEKLDSLEGEEPLSIESGAFIYKGTYGNYPSWYKPVVKGEEVPLKKKLTPTQKRNKRRKERFNEAREAGEEPPKIQRKEGETVAAFQNRKRRVVAAMAPGKGLFVSTYNIVDWMLSAAKGTGKQIAVAHAVGCDATMGKGFAKIVKSCFGSIPSGRLGQIYEQTFNNLELVHMYLKPQSGIPGSVNVLQYLNCLKSAIALMTSRDDRTIHMPYLVGAGLDEIDPALILSVLTCMADQYNLKVVLHPLEDSIPQNFLETFNIRKEIL